MDIALIFDATTLSADLSIQGSDLALDNSLKTAVLVSLFTDRRANDDDVLPDDDGAGGGSADRRGWWGDWYSAEELQAAKANGTLSAPTDRIGSRLWLLSREKQRGEVLRRAKEYAEEALAWLIQDNVARRVDVTTEITADETLGMLIEITRPAGAKQAFRFSYAWEAL